MTQASTANKQRDRFIQLLRELFQLNQPDLDFGLYRIMHAKSAEIEKFLSEDLLAVIATTFGGSAQAGIDTARASYERELTTAKEYGAVEPDNLPKVQQARAAYEAARDSAGDDAEIYDHLYRFFERYYDQGDFLSRRYYARETHDRAAPYSVPYDGSEVYLHWANKDQYYIKTSESFNNYSIDISKAAGSDGQNPLFGDAEATAPRRLHFKLVEAEEGEHNNVKATADKDRFFLLDATPIAWQTGADDAAELVVRFQYRADDEKTGNTGTWRDKRNTQSVVDILTALQQQAQGGDAQAGDAAAYHLALAQLVSKGAKKAGGKQDTQPLLAKYLHQYTAKNTMDYFIHKDLGGFLKRELDFYIKNEVMRLDDLGTASAPHVANFENYLSKLHTLRAIAHKLIAFLAQIEDFQKKLWLKKKFVIDTQWLVTLDRVPATMYAEVAANAAQWVEWRQLGFLIEPSQDLLANAKPGTLEYLQANTTLVLDTRFFDAEFTARLLASIDNLDDATDGVLVHSENFQALNLMQERYREQVKCIYIDPPYNTTENAIPYKNTFKHSSWISLIQNRCEIGRKMNSKDGSILFAIDDTEMANARLLLNGIYGINNYISTISVEVNPAGQNIRENEPAKSHDYFHAYAKDINCSSINLRGLTPEEKQSFNLVDDISAFLWDNLRRRGGNSRPDDRPNQWYPLYVTLNPPKVSLKNFSDAIEIFPLDPHGERRIWRVSPDGARKDILSGDISVLEKAGRVEVVKKTRIPEGRKPKTMWYGGAYSGTTYGSKLLKDILNTTEFSYPKSVNLVENALIYWADKNSLILDFFAGSGTTGHAVISQNKKDNGSRKYLLIEMGGYFDSVLKRRVSKIIFSSDWKNGKCTGNDGISQLVKVIRLESYEDTLNNLQLAEMAPRQQAITTNSQLREDYFLNYMLALETRGSPSLLNVAAFTDPTAYQLDVKRPGSDAHALRTVDLVETFNWLIGLRVDKLHAPQTFAAEFEQEADADLPAGSPTRLLVKGKLKEVAVNAELPSWWFRSVEGRVPGAAGSLIDQRVLVVWRKLSGNLEQDNAVLDAYLRQVLRLDLSNSQDKNQFDVIYVNGSHTLPKLPHCDIRLLEQAFHQRMWESQDV
ncbi:site-specific DNA-methyltransferase [Janthinobacterium sp. BJB401]|uniref:site-specific DNA-methyltransferase n=1 Tax=Janthinobacterium sp. BJB401 TaxID=2745934 RepID=UPI001595E528|nr:site-specific DNA-methyltransferase [Janthinobacterium sp. BJB401]NVI81371.1 site-specific DNA-methyltransferase [Janthinobacterium sp. BJB401]